MDDAKEHAAKVDLSLDKAEADGRVIMQQIVDMGKQRKLVNSKVYMVGLSSFICQQLVLAVVMNAGTKGEPDSESEQFLREIFDSFYNDALCELRRRMQDAKQR